MAIEDWNPGSGECGQRATMQGGGETAFDALVESLQARRHTAMETLLHTDILYEFADLPTLKGRAVVVAYWRRVFASIVSLQVRVRRRISDGPIVIAAYKLTFDWPQAGTIVADTLAVLEIENGQIRRWIDGFGMQPLDPDIRSICERLRADRW